MKKSTGKPTKAQVGRFEALRRLKAKIDIKGEDECWPWTACIGTWGYGSFWLEGKNLNSSRAAYLLMVCDVPKDKVVCHSCDNPACCNPKHLWIGTQGDNVRDCATKGRAKGHFSETNHPRHLAKLTPEAVIEARRLWKSGVSQSEIARLWKMDSSTISRAVKGNSWGHIK